MREPLRGYRIAGKIARASRVVIGEYRPPAPDETPAPAQAPKPQRRSASEAEPTLEEIIARAEALDPPAEEPEEPEVIAGDADLEDAEPLWHDPQEDEK